MVDRLPVVVVHGGAGDIDSGTRERREAACRAAANAGLAAFAEGLSALDAVQRAVEILESDPQFNAGTGGSLTWDGGLELDASIMEGTSLRSGAVAVLPPFLHPIAIARAVLEDGWHVMYAAAGAADFARAHGFSDATLSEMVTPDALARLERYKAGRVGPGWAGGTVGAVACDSNGRVAAATSTGGTIGKRSGRVGDTPIVGAGTWADDRCGAASATGIGEAIMRIGLTRSACEFLRDHNASEAAKRAIATFGERVGGEGGLILVSAHGDVGIAFNTSTMSHAVARAGETAWSGT